MPCYNKTGSIYQAERPSRTLGTLSALRRLYQAERPSRTLGTLSADHTAHIYQAERPSGTIGTLGNNQIQLTSPLRFLGMGSPDLPLRGPGRPVAPAPYRPGDNISPHRRYHAATRRAARREAVRRGLIATALAAAIVGAFAGMYLGPAAPAAGAPPLAVIGAASAAPTAISAYCTHTPSTCHVMAIVSSRAP